MNNTAIQTDNLVKTIPQAGRELQILRGVSLTIDSGESVAITGTSGSGKSTLLGLLAGLDLPTSGSVQALRAITGRVWMKTSVLPCASVGSASCSNPSTCWKTSLRWKTSCCRWSLGPTQASPASGAEQAGHGSLATSRPGRTPGPFPQPAFWRRTAAGGLGTRFCHPPANPVCRRTHRQP